MMLNRLRLSDFSAGLKWLSEGLAHQLLDTFPTSFWNEQVIQ